MSCLCHQRAVITEGPPCPPSFDVGSWDLNYGPHTCKTHAWHLSSLWNMLSKFKVLSGIIDKQDGFLPLSLNRLAYFGQPKYQVISSPQTISAPHVEVRVCYCIDQHISGSPASKGKALLCQRATVRQTEITVHSQYTVNSRQSCCCKLYVIGIAKKYLSHRHRKLYFSDLSRLMKMSQHSRMLK